MYIFVFIVVSLFAVSSADWLNQTFWDPPLLDADKKLFVKIGMTPKKDCSEIQNTTTLIMYVGPDVHKTCQGWTHFIGDYPDTSRPHYDQAIHAQCVDGGVTYDQFDNTEVPGCDPSITTRAKHDYNEVCKRGFPPTVFTEITDFSGCIAQGYKPTGPTEAPANFIPYVTAGTI